MTPSPENYIEKAERKRIETICEESEWQCPEHGNELKISPPLCEECNQCLEVNVIVANLCKALLSEDTKEEKV